MSMGGWFSDYSATPPDQLKCSANEIQQTYKVDKQPRKKGQMKVESHTNDRAEVTKEKKQHSKQDLLPCN